MIDESLAPATVPAGLRIYAIGDSHGCADRLSALHGLIAAREAAWPAARVLIVHLGDYVDRGPDSAAVVALLRGAPPVPGAAVVNLRGNHEQMMLDALDAPGDRGAVALWHANGGMATLRSYGADPARTEGWGAVPAADRAWLRGLPTSHAVGGFLFVHAGVDPRRPLDRQDPMDLLWIREPFLSWRGPLPAVVVHGHTVSDAPEVRPHRIGVDTGCAYGGKLSCAVLEADRVGFLVV